MKKILILVLVVLLLAGCSAPAGETTASVPESTAVETTLETEIPTTAPIETQPQPERFLITFTGDCTLGSNPHNYYAGYGFIKTVGENWDYPFANVIDWFRQDDLTLVNLEGTFCDSGNPVPKAHNFRGPVNYVNFLTENSVEAVTLANNHSMDYGRNGYDSTVTTLEEAGVIYAEEKKTRIFTTDSGLTVGIYGQVYSNFDVDHMIAAVTEMKEQGVELIIVAPHWGGEGFYLPNRIQQEAGRAAIDAGAHIVWGSHPHVLQPIESYNGGVIYYSLGNFSFGGNIYPEDHDTVLLQQEVIREPDGSVHLGDLTVIPASISSIEDRNNFQPTPYPENSEDYSRVMKKLGLAQ